jgi:hypothetical protein
VVGLASLGWARPLTSILLSHGTTVASALVSAVRQARSEPLGLPPAGPDLR